MLLLERREGRRLGVGERTDLPEVDNDFVGFRVTSVVGVLLPILDVDVGDTTDEELQFALVEDVD